MIQSCHHPNPALRQGPPNLSPCFHPWPFHSVSNTPVRQSLLKCYKLSFHKIFQWFSISQRVNDKVSKMGFLMTSCLTPVASLFFLVYFRWDSASGPLYLPFSLLGRLIPSSLCSNDTPSVRPTLTTGFKMALPSSSHPLSLSLVYFSPKYLLSYCIIYLFILFIVLFYPLGCVLHDDSTFCLLFWPIYPQGQELFLVHYWEALNQNILTLSIFILEPH